jgi:hypothetical protein
MRRPGAERGKNKQQSCHKLGVSSAAQCNHEGIRNPGGGSGQPGNGRQRIQERLVGGALKRDAVVSK